MLPAVPRDEDDQCCLRKLLHPSPEKRSRVCGGAGRVRSQAPQHPQLQCLSVASLRQPKQLQDSYRGLAMEQACVYTSQDSQHGTEDRAHGEGGPDTYREF